VRKVGIMHSDSFTDSAILVYNNRLSALGLLYILLRFVYEILYTILYTIYIREQDQTEKHIALPFLGEECVRLLGRGADSYPHFTHGPFSHSALENWHPDDKFHSANLSSALTSRSATNDRCDDTLPITLHHGRVLRPSTTTRQISHSTHVAIGIKILLPSPLSRIYTYRERQNAHNNYFVRSADFSAAREWIIYNRRAPPRCCPPLSRGRPSSYDRITMILVFLFFFYLTLKSSVRPPSIR